MEEFLKGLSRKFVEASRFIFEKVVDFEIAEYEIAFRKSIRQTVLGTGSRTGRSFLPVFRVLQTRSLDFAQLFPSAYFNERYPRMVYTIRGFFIPQLIVNISGCSPFVKLKFK
jgi:hypothetical protein